MHIEGESQLKLWWGKVMEVFHINCSSTKEGKTNSRYCNWNDSALDTTWEGT